MWSAVLVVTWPEGVDGVPRPKEFTVWLTAWDRAMLTKVVSSGRHPARTGAVDAAAAGTTGSPDRGDTADGPLHDRTGPPKGGQKPHLKACWTIPPEQNAAFVTAIEDVLGVYARPYDPTYSPMTGPWPFPGNIAGQSPASGAHPAPPPNPPNQLRSADNNG